VHTVYVFLGLSKRFSDSEERCTPYNFLWVHYVGQDWRRSLLYICFPSSQCLIKKTKQRSKRCHTGITIATKSPISRFSAPYSSKRSALFHCKQSRNAMVPITMIPNDYCSSTMDEVSSHTTTSFPPPASHRNPLGITLRDAIMVMPDRTLDSTNSSMLDWNHRPHLDSQVELWPMENHRPYYHQRMPGQAGKNNINKALLVTIISEALALIADDLDQWVDHAIRIWDIAIIILFLVDWIMHPWQ